MLIFSQFILEIADTIHRFSELPQKYSDRNAYIFKHKEKPFTVSISDSEHGRNESDVEFTDNTKKLRKQKYELSHEHPNDAIKILSTVHHIVKHHLNNYPNINKVHFTSDDSEPSRSKLYKNYTNQYGGSTEQRGDQYIHSIPADNLR